MTVPSPSAKATEPIPSPKPPLICITAAGRCTDTDPRRRVLELNRAYADAVSAAGGIPIIAAEQSPNALAEICGGLLLSGGCDIEPRRFGEQTLNSTVTTDPQRDEFEFALFDEFYKRGKPIFGICRGCQVINVALGGTLYQDLVEQLGFVHSHPDIRHPVTAEPDSILRQLFGESFRVNSTHHQSVRVLAPDLRATAYSVEGIVEAFEHTSRPIFAVQFHPERLTAEFLPLFEYFVGRVLMCGDSSRF